MRIVHLITSLTTGGAQMMLYKLLCGMDRATFDPVVVALTDAGTIAERIHKLGIPVHVLGMRANGRMLLSLWRLVRVVRHAAPDLLQGWQYHGNLAAQLVRMYLPARPPVLWNIRHSLRRLGDEKWLTAVMIKLGAKLSNMPEKIIYVANSSAVHHEALGYRADKRICIPNGFDTERYRPSTHERQKVRSELGISNAAVLIGKMARFHPMKDHANFLQAAAYLLRSHPEAQFLLAGERVDESNFVLTDMIEQLQLREHVHLLGERADVPRVLAALDVATSTSLYGEGFSNAIGEAMACGIPCVVTDVGDSPWIVGNTGRVVPPANPEALADAWRELVEMQPTQRERLGLAARQRIVQHFSLPTIVDGYAQLYRDTAKRRAATSAAPY